MTDINFTTPKKNVRNEFSMAFACVVHRNNQVKMLKNESILETTTERIKNGSNSLLCVELSSNCLNSGSVES